MLSGGLAEKCRAAALPLRVSWPKVRHHSLSFIVSMAYRSRLLNAIPASATLFSMSMKPSPFPMPSWLR